MHGEESEMGRMRTKLREDYPDLNVCAPQNCQTIALRVPPDRSADIVGRLAEEVSDAKRSRTEVSGLLLEDSTGGRALLTPGELASHTALSVCQVEQCQRFAFPHGLAALGRALRETYDDVEVVDGGLSVCACVRVGLREQVLSVTWDASPIADLVADSVALTAIELAKSPPAAQVLRSQEDAGAREARLFRVLCTLLRQEFGHLELDEAAQTCALQLDGSAVAVDFASRGVKCDNGALRERVRLCLRRCEAALRPLPHF
mmetsp:Transcript_85268/g.265001  ORF Transcript_85268/g.265001 Transcript_85268/m.265001 type:complete len:260 (+) Transcript_85268:1232-2011(+)